MLLVDKPADITSATVVSRVKALLNAKKAGHAGTLDPFATGLLICLVGKATRLADFFLHGNKAYEGLLCLGTETDTLDGTGTVTATSDITGMDLTTERIYKTIAGFQGEYDQPPPAYSAVKHNGKPLYDYARRGVTIEKPHRRVAISAISVGAVSLPLVRFSVECSGGTYIRVLAADIGKALGCGAYLKSLRRIAACGFSVTNAVTIEMLTALASQNRANERLIGMNDALWRMPRLDVDKALAARILNGARLTTKELAPPPGLKSTGVFKATCQNRLLGVMEKTGDAYRYRCVFPD